MEATPEMQPLTNPKWEHFAQLVAAKTPKGEAYAQAGYRPNASGASALLKKPEVVARIRDLQELGAAEAGIDVQWWVERVTEVAERCMSAKPVMRLHLGPMDDSEENEAVGEYQFNPSGANKALEMLGKHIGAFQKDNEQQPKAQGAVIIQYPVRDDEK